MVITIPVWVFWTIGAAIGALLIFLIAMGALLVYMGLKGSFDYRR